MTVTEQLTDAAVVDDLLTSFLNHDVPQGRYESVLRLARDLREVRGRNTAGDWKRLIAEVVRVHPALPFLHQDAMAQRCFEKPRGYAGDAALLDLIYRHPFADAIVSRTTETGKRLMEHTIAGPGPQAVRNRKQILTRELKRASADYPNCAVLSLACGHLRELEACDSTFGRFIAFDQDAESLAEVNRQYAGIGVETCAQSVKKLLSVPKHWAESFDFIYAAGLYDYLSDRFAERLTATILGMLKPGGRMLIANFLPGIPDVGYLESVMDWWLLYRSPSQIEGFLNECDPAKIASKRLFEEPNHNIAFLEVQRC